MSNELKYQFIVNTKCSTLPSMHHSICKLNKRRIIPCSLLTSFNRTYLMSKVTDWILFDEAQWLRIGFGRVVSRICIVILKQQISDLKSKGRGPGSNSGSPLHR